MVESELSSETCRLRHRLERLQSEWTSATYPMERGESAARMGSTRMGAREGRNKQDAYAYVFEEVRVMRERGMGRWSRK